jgi:zinc/manganese transport system ATP-binding protein
MKVHRPADVASVQLHDLTISWHGHPAVHHLSGVFRSGCLTAIVGPNGAGKSSLLSALTGAPVQMTGHIEQAGGQVLAHLPQADEMDRQFPIRVDEFVAMGLWSQIGWLGSLGARQRALLREALTTTGLDGLQGRLMGELSVGQRQRARFARLILQDADLILLDEPFNAVDSRTTTDLLALLPRWRAEGRTVVAVLHELDLVRQCFDEVLLLAREAVAWGPLDLVLTPANLARARQMTEAWDERAPVCAGAPHVHVPLSSQEAHP